MFKKNSKMYIRASQSLSVVIFLSFHLYNCSLSFQACKIGFQFLLAAHHLILDKSGINEKSMKINVDLKLFPVI